MRRAAIIVLDGLGIGPAHDQASYGDSGSDTLGNVARAGEPLRLPNLEWLGLGCCATLPGIAAVDRPAAAYGVAEPVSPGKDSTTGHWELCGVVIERAFPVFPHGFPSGLIEAFRQQTGRGILGNIAASGTEIIERFGTRHLATGDWIVYTSADSVFQVAAHEEKVPLEELYAACVTARELLAGPLAVARVIARPFVGSPGSFWRTGNRRDLSLPPPGVTLLDRLAEAGLGTRGVGKVDDLFAARNISSRHAPTNPEAYTEIISALTSMPDGLLLANVIEFDQSWGHRNDVAGFRRGLAQLDEAVPEILATMRSEDLVIFTADHGNDPTTPSTDHSRERVPVLAVGPQLHPVPLGVRRSFADVGQTVAEFLGVAPLASGTSFLDALLHG
ncbi:MAG: phosphopentomutase [Gemmatimonadota bacterium]